MKNGKYIDGIKTEPRTNSEVHARWKNNFIAQFIGLSGHAKTIEVVQL